MVVNKALNLANRALRMPLLLLSVAALNSGCVAVTYHESRPTTSAPKASVISGPMAGANAIREAKIWLQSDLPAQATVEYWPQSLPNQRQRSSEIPLTQKADYAATFTLINLQPGTDYAYRILLNGESASATQQFSSQALWQWRRDAPDFSLQMGSCAYINESEYDRPGTPYGDQFEIFKNMAQRKPDYVLWLGDNFYTREVDYTSESGMRYRFRHDRAFEPLQPLLRTGHHLAIWDDHDYGPNNSGASFVHKGLSLDLFKRYWPNPSFGLPETPGIFSIASINDADIFLMDDRYYRDHDDQPESLKNKSMFGAQQMRWLKNALLASVAKFKIIAGASQMLHQDVGGEGWHNFPRERQEFLDWLSLTKIEGLLFLSGDKHHTVLLKSEREEGYPLYELTCSPLTAGVYPPPDGEYGQSMVEGTLFSRRNFCELEFSGTTDDRAVTIKVFDSDAHLIWKEAIRYDTLKY